MMFASLLSQRFSVVTVLKNLAPMIRDIAIVSGIDEKLASVRYVDIPVLQLTDKGKLKKAIFTEMLNAIEKDRAHAIVLGCTGMRGIALELIQELNRSGYDIPLIDPTAASLKFAEALVRMKVKQSKITYMPPPEKERRL
jgi:allantoin racemase